MVNKYHQSSSVNKKVDPKEIVERTKPHGPGYPIAYEDYYGKPKPKKGSKGK